MWAKSTTRADTMEFIKTYFVLLPDEPTKDEKLSKIQ